MKRKVAISSMVVVLIASIVGTSFGTGFSALTAYINPELKISVNGIGFIPKDANGNTLTPVVINGSTYLPVKALGQALGANVTYDGGTKTVSIISNRINPAEPTADSDTDQSIKQNMLKGGVEIVPWFVYSTYSMYTVSATALTVNGNTYKNGLTTLTESYTETAPYAQISGQFEVDDSYKSVNGIVEVDASSGVTNSGRLIITDTATDAVLEEISAKAGERKIFSVDISGYKTITISFVKGGNGKFGKVVIGNIEFFK